MQRSTATAGRSASLDLPPELHFIAQQTPHELRDGEVEALSDNFDGAQARFFLPFSTVEEVGVGMKMAGGERASRPGPNSKQSL
jgi:hypothetical protein